MAGFDFKGKYFFTHYFCGFDSEVKRGDLVGILF